MSKDRAAFWKMDVGIACEVEEEAKREWGAELLDMLTADQVVLQVLLQCKLVLTPMLCGSL